jgi:hypothetical protein
VRWLVPSLLVALVSCAEGETPHIGGAAADAVAAEVTARFGEPVDAVAECPGADDVERLEGESVTCEWTVGTQGSAVFVVSVGPPPDLALSVATDSVLLVTAEVEQTVRSVLDEAGLDGTRFDCAPEPIIVAEVRATFECTAVSPVVTSTTTTTATTLAGSTDTTVAAGSTVEAGSAAEVIGVITVLVLDETGRISVRV